MDPRRKTSVDTASRSDTAAATPREQIVSAPPAWRRSLPGISPELEGEGFAGARGARARQRQRGGDTQCHSVPGVAAPWPFSL